MASSFTSVLGGEPVSGFPPLLVPPDVPRYDWRELRRWSISERRLPPGSVMSSGPTGLDAVPVVDRRRRRRRAAGEQGTPDGERRGE
jgi:hypothetical protein